MWLRISNLHSRLAEIDIAVVAQLKAHHVLHDPVKPLRIADKKVRRSEAIREVGEDGQGERACCWISERFRPAPWTYRLFRWQAKRTVIREGGTLPCPAWDGASLWRCSAARRRRGRLACAQQPAMPVIGFLSFQSPGPSAAHLSAYRRGLNEEGYIEGQNVGIEFRWAEGRSDRLPELAADLVRRRVSVIAAPGSALAALAAKAATTTIPIVFGIAEDPVKRGLVTSLARPDGNATGISFFTAELVAKQLGLLRELLPGAVRVAVLVNPADAARAESISQNVEAAARVLGLQIAVLNASTAGEIDAVFASLARERADALLIGADPFFNSRRVQLATLAARHAIPSASGGRDGTEAGLLVSYGTSVADMYRRVGGYTGRILKGAKPADLPVEQPTKFELVINLQTARTLGIEVPPTLLARADEVIE
jgi:putative ABC transport system substrate-binding protein